MQIIKGLTVIRTDRIDLPGQTIKVPVFSDEAGDLWTESCLNFQEDTWKLLVDPTGMVRGYTKVADSFSLLEDELFCDVVEISEDSLPKNFFSPSLFTFWVWCEERGVERRELPPEETLSTNQVIKDSILDKINRDLQPLQLSEKHGDQTNEESKEQSRLEKLMIQVGRIDPSSPDIDWPVV